MILPTPTFKCYLDTSETLDSKCKYSYKLVLEFNLEAHGDKIDDFLKLISTCGIKNITLLQKENIFILQFNNFHDFILFIDSSNISIINNATDDSLGLLLQNLLDLMGYLRIKEIIQ